MYTPSATLGRLFRRAEVDPYFRKVLLSNPQVIVVESLHHDNLGFDPRGLLAIEREALLNHGCQDMVYLAAYVFERALNQKGDPNGNQSSLVPR